MNKIKSEIDKDIMEAYSTKDFEFVVACMALSAVDIRVLRFTEYIGGRRPGQVLMHLAIYEDDKPIEGLTAVFEKLRLEYQNKKFIVEPRVLFENQRTLRSMIIDAVDKMKKIRNR